MEDQTPNSQESDLQSKSIVCSQILCFLNIKQAVLKFLKFYTESIIYHYLREVSLQRLFLFASVCQCPFNTS